MSSINDKRNDDFTDRAHFLLKDRYYWDDEERPSDLFKRVADSIASAESTEEERKHYAEVFYDLMMDRYFIPNTPTLKNAGNPDGMLSACLVLGPVEDSRESIFQTLQDAVEAMSKGSGVGYNFSLLRPKGDLIKSNMGQSSGPMSFMEVFHQTVGKTIKQSAMRPGAQMGMIKDNHPDVWHGNVDILGQEILDEPESDFINYKRFYREKQGDIENILRRMTSFNVSIVTSDDFMQAVENDGEWNLEFNNEVRRTIRARDMWEAIIDAAWHTGDPGLFFVDTTHRGSPMGWKYKIEATNPCGEQPLPNGGSCNLGHLNLGKYVTEDGGVDWKLLQQHINLAVRFLDNVVTKNRTPIKYVQGRNDKERRIGLGVAGLADMFIKLGIKYGSDESVALTEKIMNFIFGEAHGVSIALAQEKGEFEDLDREAFVSTPFAKEKLDSGYRDMILERGIRNCTLLTIAPTGTTGQIIGASGMGLEPVHLWEMLRMDSFGAHMYRVPIYDEYVKEHSESTELPEHWVASDDIDVDDELSVMEAAQRWVGGAISKTYNLPESATREDIEHIYMQAWKRGLKGVTVYRDNSLATGQVQNRVETKEGPDALDYVQKLKRPDVLTGETRRARLSDKTYYITLNSDDDDRLREMFVSSADGEDEWVDTVSILVSMLLHHKVHPIEISEKLEGISKRNGGEFWEGGFVSSTPAVFGRIIREFVEGNGSSGDRPNVEGSKICPQCKQKTLQVIGGCMECLDDSCGYSKCD